MSSKLVAWIIFAVGVGIVGAYWFSTLERDPMVVNAAPGEAGGPQIEITVAGEANGTVTVELFENLAPEHAARIVTLAEEGAYDGVVFHRVIDGFMAQTGDVEFGKAGGDMRRAGTGGSQYPDLPAEFSQESFEAGTVGMARSQSPDSANSQFFIMFEPAPHLDGAYTVVGRVIEGMDVVNEIKRGDGPNGAVVGAPDVMQSVRVIEE
ncbi:peptidylprolyl isomerase [Maritimibacter sp. DP4N28-5]|uniref:peptidylprolyl isomerase n=2 Tax=Maritimibacter dapengensis TaxID=2836868 RepID=A0ABS6SZH2_9RHOB|nr:peptidylprolyl isomerase [Maritimibacter dapengensis]MBV7378357.1 peptidylprolyl isomerase [Maritimibacter dapengensis]